jgi:integrase/recombinase XerD
MELYDPTGQRLYLTDNERQAFAKAANASERDIRTFCLVLLHTGCRISEALELTPKSVDFAAQTITFRTLKKRGDKPVYRAIPAPPFLLDTLDLVHTVKARQQKRNQSPLWEWSRTTAWRRVQEVMGKADIADGAHKCPKGLRHGYGVHAISSNVPLNMLRKWMGHSSLEVTEIYANALGAEQHSIAARMWDNEP